MYFIYFSQEITHLLSVALEDTVLILLEHCVEETVILIVVWTENPWVGVMPLNHHLHNIGRIEAVIWFNIQFLGKICASM